MEARTGMIEKARVGGQSAEEGGYGGIYVSAPVGVGPDSG